MFDIPGFDPRSMTDDELLRRQEALEGRLAYVARAGGASEMVVQMQAMLQVIEATRRERMFLMVMDVRANDDPVVVETDPSLRPQPEEVATEQPVRPMPARRPAAIPIPRATPRPSRTATDLQHPAPPASKGKTP